MRSLKQPIVDLARAIRKQFTVRHDAFMDMGLLKQCVLTWMFLATCYLTPTFYFQYRLPEQEAVLLQAPTPAVASVEQWNDRYWSYEADIVRYLDIIVFEHVRMYHVTIWRRSNQSRIRTNTYERRIDIWY